jgi:hypothetical protein
MNERIQELILEAGFPQFGKMYVVSDGEELKQFAELIIKECCEVLEQTEDALDRQKWPTPRGCVKYIKDYFGDE